MSSYSRPPVRAVLRSLWSFDVPEGLERYQPAEPDSFGIRVKAFIADPVDDGGVDAFDFLVCSPRWFANNFPEQGEVTPSSPLYGQGLRLRGAAMLGWGCVFLATWSYEALFAAVTELCHEQLGPDWQTVASRIGRELPWEFQGFYDDEVNAGAGLPRRGSGQT